MILARYRQCFHSDWMVIYAEYALFDVNSVIYVAMASGPTARYGCNRSYNAYNTVNNNRWWINNDNNDNNNNRYMRIHFLIVLHLRFMFIGMFIFIGILIGIGMDIGMPTF